jgi:hypothetical protein
MSFSEVMTVLEAVQNCAAEKSSGLPLERFRMTGTFLKRASMEWWLFQYALMGAWRYGKTGGIMLVSCDSKKSSPSLGALLADFFEFGPRLIEKVSGPKSVCLACIV